MKEKSFLAKWKDGILAITPFQQARITYFNTYIIFIGLIVGMTYARKYELYWLLIILIGAFFNTAMQQLGNYQKYITYKRLEDMKGENLI